MYINKAMIFGNLTRDPELKSIPSGTKVCNFSVATNRTWKDQSGTKQDSTEYHNVVCFAKLAELVGQYLRKGSSVYIEGRLQTRSWEQEGQKKYRTEIIAETIQFGPKSGGAQSSGSYAQPAPKQEDDQLDTIEYPTADINPEDIPF